MYAAWAEIMYVILIFVGCGQVGTPLIRGISGGERKRTNIGMELLIDPSVLFLDEPTTGLDASTANSVLLLLKRYVHGIHLDAKLTNKPNTHKFTKYLYNTQNAPWLLYTTIFTNITKQV